MPALSLLTLITRFLLTALRGLAVAAAIVLLALLLGWTSLQWFVAPRLDSYRPQLTAWASRALDAQVAVQQLSVDGSWWHPVVVARGLEITGANSQPGLRTARASLRLSPLAWLRGSVSALEVDAPEIWVRRNAAGALSVAGVPSAANADGAGWVRHLLLLQPAVALQDARLHWLDALHGGELTLDNMNLRMRGGTRRLIGQLTAGQLTARLGPGLPPLHLDALAGQVHWRRLGPSGHHAQVRFDDLNVVVDDSSRLQGMALTLDYPVGIAATAPAAPVRVRVSGVDLPVLGRLAQRLPWPEELQQALLDWPVDAGVLQTLDAQWRGPLHAPQAWRARGQIHGLVLAAVPADAGDDASPTTTVGQPGVSGLDVAFETNAAGGHATLRMDAGSLSFPGVFEDPVIPVQRLLAETDWHVDGSGGIRVNVPRLELSNADAQGQFSGSWHTGGGLPGGEARLPGTIDLQGRLTRGDGARVHRYLPLVLPADARHYVRDAIIQGRLSDVAARVQGPLDQVPFNRPGKEGTFSITGRVDDGVMAYVPPRFQDAGEPQWPTLTGLAGQLAFEGASMRVRQASGQVQGHAGWAFADINADIADFDAARVTVDASGRGPLATALAIVRASPLAAMTEHALDPARASGNARLQLALDLPLDDLPRTTVRGSVQLEQNAITLRAGVPPLEAARGTISFTETGFALDDVRARTLGGAVTLSGGLRQGGQGQHELARIETRGRASAAGLQHWAAQAEPALGAAWADALQGEAAYHLSLDLAADGVRTLALDSDLQGLALSLPPPLDKPAGDQWPLRLRWQRPEAAAATSQLELQLADRLALQWTLPPGPNAAPSGTMALGQATNSTQPPAGPGWALVANLDTLDVGRWAPFIRQPGAAPASPDAASRWLPRRWRVTLRHLQVAGHQLDDLTATGQRQGTHWQGEVQSPDLAGQVEYRGGGPGQAGHVMGRLSRLRVKPSATATPPSTEPTRTLPSVDLRAEHFFWNDLDLGQLDLQAIQAGTAAAPAWRMDQLRLTTPEARLQASGSRTFPPATDPAGVGQTRLQLELTVNNAGTLLERLAQPGVMAGGAGSVTGELAWPGSPLDFRVVGLTGHLQLDLANGRFVQMEPGAGRLFGILSLQALPRRLMLDFTDVFRSGWAFDRAQAHARLNRGILSTDDLQIQGVGAAVAIQGQTDVKAQTMDLQLRVEPRIDAGAAALAATAINPALGAAAFIAQLALQKPIARAAARTFRVRGTWSEPEVDPMQASTPPAQAARPEAGTPENRMPAAGENNP